MYPDWQGQPAHRSILIRQGKVEALDPDEVPPHLPRLDFPAGVVLPGFVDDHVHLFHTGLTRLTVRLDEVKTWEEAAEALRAAQTELVLATGLDEYRLDRLPDSPWLNRVLGGRPAFLKGITGHYAVANRAALDLLGIPDGTPGLDPATGYLRGTANTLASRLARERLVAEEGPGPVLRAAAEMAARHGVTTLHALEGWDTPYPSEVLHLLKERDRLPVRTVVWPQTTHLPSVLELGLPRIGGDIWVDGDFGPRTARLREPYADGSGLGELYYEPAFLADFATRAVEAGLQVAMHCVGDGAAEVALEAYRQALQQHPREDHRLRIEHFEVAAPDLLERAAELGVAVSLQPPFDSYFGGQQRALPWAGPARVGRLDAVRSFLAAGLRCGGGSDSPVTPLDPLLGLDSCANHSNPDESVDIRTAIRLYTEGSAALGFLEDQVGALRPGMLGDLVVLDGDPFTIPSHEIRRLAVLATVVGGRLVYRRPV